VSIVSKLSLSLFFLSAIVFGVYGVLHLHSERNDLRTAAEKESRLLASSLQVAIENALRDRQIEDIHELLGQLERVEPAMYIRIYLRDGRLIHSDSDLLPLAGALEHALRRAADSDKPRLLFFPGADPEFIAVSLPLAEAEISGGGSLIVVRSLAEMQRDLRATERDILISLISFVLLTAALCLALGRIYITRPLERLGAAMRRFRSGTPPGPLPIEHHDELGTVVEEFNRMVAELSAARSKLDREMEQRRQMQRTLQEADKLIVIGQLSAGLAHEIGSPLQVLNGRAHALAACAEQPEEVRRHAHILVTQTERITRIVQQLLKFAQRRPPVFTYTDLAATVCEVIDLLQYEARRLKVELRFACRDSLPPAYIDRDGVQQVLLNLITNAFAATPEGGAVSVGLGVADMKTPAGDVSALCLTVEDNGLGILPRHLPHLFESFFTTRSDCGGTGLGLAVVKSIVTEHGGMVAAKSEIGAGSCFTVYLPLTGSGFRQEAV
jgi:signal transduction histidine kinase